MNRRLFPLFAVAALVATLAGCKKQTQYTLHGKADLEPCLGKTVVLTVYANDGTLSADSTVVASDGTFLFTGSVESPCFAQLTIRGGNEEGFDANFPFFIENRHMRVKAKESKYYSIAYTQFSLTGSPTDQKYRKAFGAGLKEHLGISVFLDKFVPALEAHPDEVFSPYAYYTAMADREDYADFLRQMESFGPTARNTYHYRQMQRMVDTKSNLAIGGEMPGFTLPDTDGKPLAMKDLLHGNRCLLVDFWASWCGPCRMESPNIRQLYNDLHDKGLEVVGFSIDTDRDRWLDAVAQDSLPWANVCELAGGDSSVASRIYGIRGVPNIVLLDSQGIILATHLHGERLDSIVRSQFH